MSVLDQFLTVIVDPKVATCLTEAHVAQMIGYLNITGLNLALLLNFEDSRLEWKRDVRVKLTMNAPRSLCFILNPRYPRNPRFLWRY
jgi:hypothetical protein